MSASNSPYPGYVPAQQVQPASAQSQPNNAAFGGGDPSDTYEDRLAVQALTGQVPQSVHDMFMAMNARLDEQAYQSQLRAAQSNNADNTSFPDQAHDTGTAYVSHRNTSPVINSDINGVGTGASENSHDAGPLSAGLDSLDGSNSEDGMDLFDWSKYDSQEPKSSRPCPPITNICIGCNEIKGHHADCPHSFDFEQYSQKKQPNAAVANTGNSDAWFLDMANSSDPLPGMDFDSSILSCTDPNIDISSDGVLVGHNGQLTSDSSMFESTQNSIEAYSSISGPLKVGHNRSNKAQNQAPSPAQNSMPFQMPIIMYDPMPNYTQQLRNDIQEQWTGLQLQLAMARDEQLNGQHNGTGDINNARLQHSIQGQMLRLQELWQQHQQSVQEMVRDQLQSPTQDQMQTQTQTHMQNILQSNMQMQNQSQNDQRAPMQQSHPSQGTATPSQYRVNQVPQKIASGNGTVFSGHQHHAMNTGIAPLSAQRAVQQQFSKQPMLQLGAVQQKVSNQPMIQQHVSSQPVFQQQISNQLPFQQCVPNQPVTNPTARTPVSRKSLAPRSVSRQSTPSRAASGPVQDFKSTPTGATKRRATETPGQNSQNKRVRTALPNAAPSSPLGMDHGRPIAQLFKLKWTDMTQMEKARLLLPILNGEHPLQAERNEQVHGQSYGAQRQREALEKAQRLTDEAVKSAHAQSTSQMSVEHGVGDEEAKQQDREAELMAELNQIRAAKKAKVDAEKRVATNKKRAATIARKREEAAQAAQAAQDIPAN